MAIRTSVASGLASAGATWGGTAPVNGDQVVIAAGHTVEWDIASIDIGTDPGNQTTLALQVLGTLLASQTVSAVITLSGHGKVEKGGVLRVRGTTAGSPYPASVTFELRVNKSASMAAHKYGLDFGDATVTASNYAYHDLIGAESTTYCQLSAAASLGATTLQLDRTPVGWKAGDTLWLPDVNNTGCKTAILAADVTGTTATVTVGLSVELPKFVHIGKPAKNIRIRALNQAYPATVKKFAVVNPTFPAGTAWVAKHVELSGIGGASFTYEGASFFGSGNGPTVVGWDYADVTIDNDSAGGVTSVAGYATALPYTLGPVLVRGNAGAEYLYNLTGIVDVALIGGTTYASGRTAHRFQSGGATIRGGCYGFSNGVMCANGWSGTFDNFVIASPDALYNVGSNGTWKPSTVILAQTPSRLMREQYSAACAEVVANITMTSNGFTIPGNTYFQTTPVAALLNPIVLLHDSDGDTAQQEIWTRYGTISRDAVTFTAGVGGSLKFAPLSTATALRNPDPFSVYAEAGKLAGITGMFRMGSTKPSEIVLTLSGTGLTTPVTATLDLSGASDTWIPFIIAATPSGSGYPVLSLQIAVKGASGSFVLFDAINQLYTDLNAGEITHFQNATPLLPPRVQVPDLRVLPVAGSWPAGSIGEHLQRMAALLEANGAGGHRYTPDALSQTWSGAHSITLQTGEGVQVMDASGRVKVKRPV